MEAFSFHETHLLETRKSKVDFFSISQRSKTQRLFRQKRDEKKGYTHRSQFVLSVLKLIAKLKPKIFLIPDYLLETHCILLHVLVRIDQSRVELREQEEVVLLQLYTVYIYLDRRRESK